jgi:hypothetical protein
MNKNVINVVFASINSITWNELCHYDFANEFEYNYIFYHIYNYCKNIKKYKKILPNYSSLNSSFGTFILNIEDISYIPEIYEYLYENIKNEKYQHLNITRNIQFFSLDKFQMMEYIDDNIYKYIYSENDTLKDIYIKIIDCLNSKVSCYWLGIMIYYFFTVFELSDNYDYQNDIIPDNEEWISFLGNIFNFPENEIKHTLLRLHVFVSKYQNSYFKYLYDKSDDIMKKINFSYINHTKQKKLNDCNTYEYIRYFYDIHNIGKLPFNIFPSNLKFQ